MDPFVALAIAEKLLRHGPAAFAAIIKAFEVDEPTPEDIRALKIEETTEEVFEGR